MIRLANLNDLELLNLYDKHVSKEELSNIINLQRVYILYENNKFIGWLRYGLFWDNTPFMNMLYVLEEYRNKGYGKTLVYTFEKESWLL